MDHPAVRVVRPRPLGLNDRIPVFWAGQEPTAELKQIDGGALYRHLIAASTPTGNKKRKRTGQKYQAPKEVWPMQAGRQAAAAAAAAAAASHQRQLLQQRRPAAWDSLLMLVIAASFLCVQGAPHEHFTLAGHEAQQQPQPQVPEVRRPS
jgi:hypothetical protein